MLSLFNVEVVVFTYVYGSFACVGWTGRRYKCGFLVGEEYEDLPLNEKAMWPSCPPPRFVWRTYTTLLFSSDWGNF